MPAGSWACWPIVKRHLTMHVRGVKEEEWPLLLWPGLPHGNAMVAIFHPTLSFLLLNMHSITFQKFSIRYADDRERQYYR